MICEIRRIDGTKKKYCKVGIVCKFKDKNQLYIQTCRNNKFKEIHENLEDIVSFEIRKV